MKKKVLFIVATHGDEPIGLLAISKLAKRMDKFDWIIGNPRALLQNKRYIDRDLNRSASVTQTDGSYEITRAKEIIVLSKKYRYMIDIHGTKKQTGIFIIITKVSKENLELASRLDIQRIVLWPSFSSELKGSLSENVNCGIEIECGDKDNPLVIGGLVDVINKFIDKKIETKIDWRKVMMKKKTYIMVDSLKIGTDINIDKLREFENVFIGDKQYVPLFINSGYKDRNKIICYLAKEISLGEVENLF